MSQIIDLTSMIIDMSWKKWPDERPILLQNDLDSGSLKIEIRDFKYGEKTEGAFSDPLVGASSTYKNGTSVTNSQTFSDSRSTSAEFSWSIAKGVSFTMNATINISPPIFSGSLGVSNTLTTTTTESQRSSQSQTWSWNTTVYVPPKSIVTAKVFIRKVAINAPFSALVVLKGVVKINRAELILGVTGGAARLNPQTLMCPIGEYFTEFPNADVEVLDNLSVQIKINGEFRCEQGLDYYIETEETLIGSLSKDITKNSITTMKLITLDEPPHIGPPDGIHSTIISQSEVTKPSIACGFNDAGVPNWGRFLIETRQYDEYRDGKLIRSWTETNETFIGCVPV